jgi:uncharacterized glyoxalase superfamily protein PhnB
MDRVRGVIPMLVCGDAAAEIAFCQAAFGAVERSRRAGPDDVVVHATLAIGDALVMIHGEVATLASRAPVPDGSASVVIYLYRPTSSRCSWTMPQACSAPSDNRRRRRLLTSR